MKPTRLFSQTEYSLPSRPVANQSLVRKSKICSAEAAPTGQPALTYKTQNANLLYMTSQENIEKRLEELERDYADLMERVRDLELQVGQLTERNLHGSCSTCSLQ